MKTITIACTLAAVALMSATPLRTSAQEPAAVKPVVPLTVPQQPRPVAATPAPAPAVRVVDTANSNEAVVSMVFDETPIVDVIKAFRDATGANIISSGTNLQGIVSVRLDNVPWRKGLSSILEPQGLQLLEQPTGSGIYVVSTKTLEIPRVTRTFELNNANALDVAKLLTATLGVGSSATPFPSANVVIVTATEQQLGECEKIIIAIDKPRTQVYIEARFVELSAGASKKLGLKWDAFGGDGVGVNFDGATLGWTDDSTHSSIGKHGTSGSANSTATDKITDTFDGSTREILSDLTTETVLGNGSSRSFNETKTHDRTRAFTGSMSIDAFSLALNAFESMGGASVFSNPKIIVANEETAKVDMTTKEPNVSVRSSRSGTAGDQLDVTAELTIIPGKEEPFVGEAFFSYGISLKVTPRVSASGLITVKIEPSISEKTGDFTIQGTANTPVSSFPIIAMRRIQTVFTMESGKTAVIGGLSKTTESNVDAGLPWLRDLPWIGPRVFGWKSREKEQKEIVIFVTVGITDPSTIREDAGMPKNAILSRDLMNGKTKEPGDRTIESIMSLKDPQSPRASHDVVVTEQEAEASTPVAIEQPVSASSTETSTK